MFKCIQLEGTLQITEYIKTYLSGAAYMFVGVGDYNECALTKNIHIHTHRATHIGTS